MILKTLNLALFLTVLWLLWTGTARHHNVSQLVSQQAQQARLHASLDDRISKSEENFKEQLTTGMLQLAAAQPARQEGEEEVDPELTMQLRHEIDGYRDQLASIAKSTELKQVLSTIIEAEFLKTADSVRAADQLLSTKEIIWRKSTDESEIEQSLQSLMAPIDILAGEWQQGYTDNTVSTIYRILSESIVVLEKPGGSQ